MPERLQVQVVHVLADRVFLRDLDLPAGATVADALAASGVFDEFPALAEAPDVGVHSLRVGMERPLRNHDRVELYRPLQVDPKEARRRRATRHKS